MKGHRMAGFVPHKRRVTTTPSAHRFPDLLRGDFGATRPDEAWVSDITYIRTRQGFLYLAFVLDLASRRVLGVSVASHSRWVGPGCVGTTPPPSRFSAPSRRNSSTATTTRAATRRAYRSGTGSKPGTTPAGSTPRSGTSHQTNGRTTTTITPPHKPSVQHMGGTPHHPVPTHATEPAQNPGRFTSCLRGDDAASPCLRSLLPCRATTLYELELRPLADELARGL